jgi:hypothetical protein
MTAIAQFDQAMTVAKLRGARERKRRETGKCEGRKTLAEKFPEAVLLAKRLRRASPKTGERISMRKISAELAAAGHVNERDVPFNAGSILSMVEGEWPRKQHIATTSGYLHARPNSSSRLCPTSDAADRLESTSIHRILSCCRST